MLQVHSSFSFRYGIVDPEEVVQLLDNSGYERLVITDINNTSAVLNFVRLSQKHGKTPVAGIDFRNNMDCCFIGIAQNNEGFQELNAFLSDHLHRQQPFPERAPHFEHCFIIYPWEKAPVQLRNYERIGIASHQLNRFSVHHPENLSACVALEPMTFRTKKDFNTHRLLRAIDCNTLLSRLPETQQTRQDECFISRETLYERFATAPLLVEQSEKLLESCAIQFAFGDEATAQNKATYTGSKEGDYRLIEQKCMDAVEKRYRKRTPEIIHRIQKELHIIEQKDYLSYFLITWDIVDYARSKGYFHVGRGSGANSIIAYLLGITDVDPLELDLYFERFINLYRRNPPDFDIDFSWRDRDDVTRYIFERFPNSTLLCTYSTFQYRATVRELGKVFGLPKSEIDFLSDNKKVPLAELDQLSQLVMKYSAAIAGLPSHLSIHAGGIIISEKPVHWFSATSLPPKGYPTTQFSMLEAEDVGLHKFDILSQRGLGKIRETIDIIAYNQPDNPPHDIHDVNRFKEDPNINQLLSEARAIGCFYVESPAMRMLMIKLRTKSYLELVAASSIIRPGVAQSGMMREYILRHRNPERRHDAHPILRDLMPDTYGVMVYQEDVIKVANVFADLTLAESDVLRRSMSGKFRSRDEFNDVHRRFYDNCTRKGIPRADIDSVWNQIESFAGFAFSKGHSASYAVESYQSLYLKTYYPLEYLVATINNGGGFYAMEMYVHEARRLGANVEPPCINRSQVETAISGKTIFLGFQHINGLELKTMTYLIAEREANGPFSSFEELLQRISLPLEQLLLLIRIQALRLLSARKKELVWKAHLFTSKAPVHQQQPRLFAETHKNVELPVFPETAKEDAFEQLELLDFPLCSPFLLLNEQLPEHFKATQLADNVGREIRTYGYFINVKQTQTLLKKESMLFGTLLDIDGNQLDTVHFPQVAARFPFTGKGIYEIRGRVTTEFDFHTIEIAYLRKMSYCDDPRYVD